MTTSAVQSSPELKIGARVMCLPAGLTGEVVGIQDDSVGVRYDIGYIQWESAADLRLARPGETTGSAGLPSSDPLYADQQAKIARSQQHKGFDNAILRQGISVLGSRFRTKDLSSSRVVLNAHPYAATQRNYHATFGRYLNANAHALGIRLVSATSHARGALWEKRASEGAEGPVASGDSGGTGAQEGRRQAIENQIDRFLREVGLVPADVTDEQGWRRIGLGSTQGLVGCSEIDGIVFLRVLATVMDLPSDRELILPLLHDLLALNSNLLGPARAALDRSTVVIAATVPAEGISDDYLAFTIHNAMSIADSLIEPLKQQYGGTARQRARQRR
jgi:hypothetical protein